jgi:hypothetical protein
MFVAVHHQVDEMTDAVLVRAIEDQVLEGIVEDNF